MSSALSHNMRQSRFIFAMGQPEAFDSGGNADRAIRTATRGGPYSLVTMCAKRILFTCHTTRITHLHYACQMHLHYNPALWYCKRMELKRKPAQTNAPVPIFAVHGCRVVRVGWVPPERKAA